MGLKPDKITHARIDETKTQIYINIDNSEEEEKLYDCSPREISLDVSLFIGMTKPDAIAFIEEN